MEKCILPGSPNWYLSQVLDCSWNNKVAYGSLMSLVILDPSEITNPVTIGHAHSSRTLSVSFPPQGCGNYLLSTSESGEAFVWDIDTRKAVLSYRQPQKCALVGSWSHANGDLIVCADENGNIVQWRVNSNTITVKSFREHSFVVVSCCPHDRNLVATGTKQGLVCVVNIKVPGKEFLLHRLRGHDSEVVSLAWCPSRKNIFKPKSDEDCFLLASSAKERKIFFWRAGQDGLYEAYVETPLAPRTQAVVKHWNSVSWYDPHQLVVSTVGGEVLITNASKFKTQKNSGFKWTTFSDTHNRCHVVVKCSPWIMTEGMSEVDWRLKENTAMWVWTYGADRIVAGLCSDKLVPPVRFNTLGGAVHAMTISPIDGTSLAIGVADKSIRVVNLSEPELKTMQTFSLKVSGKVMSLAWHPSKDGWLAYGTSDGRIGIHFTCTIKPPLLFKPFSKESIYSMEWGPSLSTIKSSLQSPNSAEENEDMGDKMTASKYVLYAIGGGQIAAMDPNKPDQFFLEPFKTLLKTVLKSDSLKSRSKPVSLTDLTWKPDYSLLAIGDETGSIHLLHRNDKEELVLVANLKVHPSLIQDLAWHPLCCSADPTDVSLQANWLATASNHSNIHILDTSPVLEALESLTTDTSLPLSNIPCIVTLKGHKLRVSKLSWSPHEGGRLMSVSYDQCAQVWDVINHEPVACYALHNAPLFSCVWSPFNPSLAITAGQEGIICIWDVQEQHTKLPISKAKDGSHLFDAAIEARQSTHGGEMACANAGSQSQKPQNKKREKAVLPLSGADVQKDDCNLAILKYLLYPSENEKIELNGEYEGGAKSLPLHYAFFANQSVVEQYLMKELTSNMSQEIRFTLNVWKGSPKDAILEAIANKSLDSFIVSIAPTVSHKVWVEACAAYAEQLKLANELSRASAYLLAIHKVEDAVKLLAENGKYRHALAVARCRLPAESPLIKSLLVDWAEESVSKGVHSLAAACFGSAGEWTKAAQCLALKKTCNFLLMAAQIMKEKTNEPQVGTFYARECFNMALAQADWHTAQTVLHIYPSLNHLALCLFVYQSLRSSKDASVDEWLKLPCSETNCTKENEEDELTVSICLPTEKVAALKKDLINEVSVNSEDTAWLASSNKVTLAYLAAPSLFPRIKRKFVIDSTDIDEDMDLAFRYLVQTMSLLYHYHITYKLTEDSVPIFLKFCIWLAPQGPYSGSFEAESSTSSPAFSLRSSLRAFLAAGLLLWMPKASTDENISSLTLSLIDSMKDDIFSLESLKSFKVEFKLKVIQESKVTKALKERNEKQEKMRGEMSSTNTEPPVAYVKEPEEVSTLQILEPEKINGKESTGKKVIKSSSEEIKSTDPVFLEVNESEILTNWLQDFRKKREKVPNPYLSYSNLLQCLNSVNTDKSTELTKKYSQFWAASNESLDV